MCAAYKSSSHGKATGNNNKRNWQDDVEESESSAKTLDIWDKNPSYKDTQPRRTLQRFLFLYILLIFLFISTYLLFSDIHVALLIIFLMLTLFFIAFHDNLFNFQNSPLFMSNKVNDFDPFKDINFWTLKNDKETLLITNKKDLITIATRVFEITTLPVNVQPNLNQFLQSLNKNQIPYTYQVVHKPMIHQSENSEQKKGSLELKIKSQNNVLESFKISIYFSVYCIARGILTNYKMMNLTNEIKIYSKELQSLFYANFYHTQIKLLSDNDLVDAIRTLFTRTKIDVVQKKQDYLKLKQINPQILLKASFMAILNIYFSIVLFFFSFPWQWVLVIVFALNISIVLLYWKEILFFFTNSYLYRNDHVELVDPFLNVQFRHVKGINGTIFLLINKELLIGLKSYNLESAFYSYTMYSSRIFRVLNAQKVPFAYTAHISPTQRDRFCKECAKKLNYRTQEQLEGIIFIILDKEPKRKIKDPNIEFIKWLQKRTGIWNTTLTMSCFSYKFTSSSNTSSPDIDDYLELETDLLEKSQILQKAYEDNFLNHTLTQLKNNLLVSGFLTESLKNNCYRTNGTHLNYLYFQGKVLMELIRIVNEFKKGIETRIAAEFNTPLYLENHITIGNTINTEFLGEEGPLGLNFEQLHKTLITNGTAEARELLGMKIVAELVKKNIPSIVFDFSGNWTKLIQFYENSRLANEFLYFKLGSSFNINLLHSEIGKYDINNPLYLNYFYDVYAMAFKEQKRNIDTLKEIVLKNQELSLSSIALDLKNKQDWERANYDEILSFFSEFIQQSVIFSDKLYEYEGKITPVEFLKDDKTIILDLSILTDIEQKVFVTFVIISKIIHLVKNSSEYLEKILVIPHADLFFDSYYLDTNHGNNLNYGRVDKFLNPLIQKGFGFVFLSNQIRYLHPNVFNYTDNIITFKATDKRDIAVLKNQMNLQELHGAGYYSSKRKDTYQMEYLKNMRYDEIIIKRSDIYQPFPGIIKFKDLKETPRMNYYEIIGYMEHQGYNLKLAERKILEKAKRTLFEKDLGLYYEFKNEVINFLDGIKTVDKVAIHTRDIKKSLMAFIYPKASKKSNNKKQLKNIRDKIFDILLEHGYLETCTRKTAGGSESMGTCYVVGSQYEKALNDINQLSQNRKMEIVVDPIEINSQKEYNFENTFQSKPLDKGLSKAKFKQILLSEYSEALWNLFQVHKYIQKEDYNNALKSGSELMPTFLKALYQNFRNTFPEMGLKNKNIASFIDYLHANKLLPLTKEQLKHYFKQIELLNKDDSSIESRVKELYSLLSDIVSLIEVFIDEVQEQYNISDDSSYDINLIDHDTNNQNYVVDGANVAFETKTIDNKAKLSNILLLINKLKSLGIRNYRILCDKALQDKIDEDEDYMNLVNKNEIIETPAGSQADTFIMQYARDKDAYIISNDQFKDFYDTYGEEWIKGKRISFTIVSNEIYFNELMQHAKT